MSFDRTSQHVADYPHLGIIWTQLWISNKQARRDRYPYFSLIGVSLATSNYSLYSFSSVFSRLLLKTEKHNKSLDLIK